MDSIQLNYDTKHIVAKLIEENWTSSDIKGVFILKDCILVECFTGKNFSYRVVNYVTGEQKYLFYRRNAISDSDYLSIISKIKELAFFDMKRASDGIEMIDVILREVFAKYGFVIREDQVSLSKHMYKNIVEGKILISDIPVGLGKTHAYLVAAIVFNRFSKRRTLSKQMPIVITTSSIELQRAIIKEYMPEMSKMLMENGILMSPITCVLRKGKENYVCENRLKDYFKTLDPTRKKVTEYEALRKLLTNGLIDLGEVNDISGYDKRKINVKSSQCMKCSQFKTCMYQRFMKQAKKGTYDFQICNHNYYLADLLKRKDGRHSLLPDHKIVIIDEAHKLKDAAEQMYGSSICENELHHLMKRLMPADAKKKGQKVFKNRCSEVMALNQMIFDELVERISKHLLTEETEKFPAEITQRISALVKKLIVNLQELLQIMTYKERQYEIDLNNMVEALKTITSVDNICWLENPQIKGGRTLVSLPKVVSKELGADLWSGNRAMILTSGTLGVNGDFSYTKRQLALDQVNNHKIEELSKDSPFDYKNNCMLYIPEHLPYPNTEDANYIDRVSREIARLIDASNGHALVLFTSYKPLRLMYNLIQDQISKVPLIAMSRGKNNSISDFKKGRNAVLFATGSIWEGVNIAGDILSHLIIVKLPFPIPDPISDYEKSLCPDMNVYLDSVLIPKMLIKLRQGVGRLIRSETDTGVISILDARASVNGRYHNAVLSALPDCQLTSDFDEIELFLKSKKNNEYFD